MANAILSISVQRGYDVTDYVMNSFGGAGGQHACLVADALGIGSVLIHPLSGVLSAYGMGLAELKATRSRAVLRLLDAEGLAAAEALAAPLADDAKEELEGQGVARAGIRVSVLGASPLSRHRQRTAGAARHARRDSRRAFEAMHRQRFGFVEPGQADRDRGDRGRGAWRRRPSARARPAALDRRAAGTADHDEALHRRRLARRACLLARRPRARPLHRGPCPDHRAASDRRGRAGLAGRGHGEEPSAAHPRRANAKRGPRSAPASIPCCSKCSTSASRRSPSRWAMRCRTPRARSTSRSGSISPAPSSMATAASSPTRRISRCISARWTAASRRCGARSAAISRPAMCGC